MGSARIDFSGHTHGTGKGFEGSFDDVVGVDTVQLPDMQGHEAVVNNGHKEFTDELGVVSANALGGNVETIGKVWATGEVQGDLNQGFVQGSYKVAKTDDAFTVAQGLVKGHTEGNANVLVSVVIVDFEVAFGLNIQIK